MRLKHSRSIFCFCFFIHVSLAYSTNDWPVKNGPRTNPKKYHPANVENSGETILRHSSKFPHFDQIRTRIAGLDSDRRFSDSRSFNSDARFGESVRLRHHGWSNRARGTTTTTTTTTPSPDDDLFYNYGELDEDEMVSGPILVKTKKCANFISLKNTNLKFTLVSFQLGPLGSREQL